MLRIAVGDRFIHNRRYTYEVISVGILWVECKIVQTTIKDMTYTIGDIETVTKGWLKALAKKGELIWLK